MPNQHLKLSASGHLKLHSSGHLKLWTATTYTLNLVSTVEYAGDIFRSGSDYAAKQNEAIAAMASCTPNFGGSVVYLGASDNGASALSNGYIWEVVPLGGASFGSPVAASIVILCGNYTPPYHAATSDGYGFVGTGSSVPTGIPRTWGKNLWTGSSNATLTNVSVQRYIWWGCDLSSWSGSSTNYGAQCHKWTVGTISD